MGHLHFKYKQKKTNYLAVGSWDGTVKILNNEYKIIREIRGGEQYKLKRENENDSKHVLETGADINVITNLNFSKFILQEIIRDFK